MKWNFEGSDVPEKAVSLDMFRYSNKYFLALAASFLRQSVNCFLLTYGNVFFRLSIKFLSYIRTGVLIDQKWQSAFRTEISRHSNLSFSKTTHSRFLSWSILAVICFWKLNRWNDQWLYATHWNIIRLNMPKGPNNFLVLPFFRLINTWSKWLDFICWGLSKWKFDSFQMWFDVNFFLESFLCVFLLIWKIFIRSN